MLREKTKKGAGRSGNPSYNWHEICRNPWNDRCEKTEIALYIFHEGEMLPICRQCWYEIADRNFELGEEIGLKS